MTNWENENRDSGKTRADRLGASQSSGRNAGQTKTRLSCGGVELAADALNFGHDAECVFTKDLADVGFGIALLKEAVGDLRQVGYILHADGHVGSVEIGAQTDVIDSGNFHGVVNVLDDFGPLDFGNFAGLHEIADNLIAGDEGAGFTVPAAFLDFGFDFLFGVRVCLFEVTELLTEEANMIVDLNDAAIFCECAHHVVGHVTGSFGEGARGRVGSDNGSLGSGDDVVEGLVGNVRDIDHDAETVHFEDHLLAKIGEAVVSGSIGGRISPIGVAHVGEGHVANAECRVGAEDGEVIVQHMATFDTYQHCDFVLFLGSPDLSNGDGEDKIVGMFADGFADGVDLIKSPFDGFWAGDFAGNPDGEVDGIQAAFTHARDVDIAVSVAGADVEGGVKKPLRGVVVGVDDDGGVMEFFGFVGDRLCSGGDSHKEEAEETQCEKQERAAH
jgi:hypothetical protein